MSSSILVTTTNTIEGYTIIKYFEMISSRVVIGAGAFSEFFAAFTDVFGGRSMKFEERLNELNDDAMALIKKSAVRLGANAIISTKIDIDEISGKGTQMFMMSVSGTPVYIKKNTETSEQNQTEKDKTIFFRDIEEKMLANKYQSEILKVKTIDKLNSLIEELIKNEILLPANSVLSLLNRVNKDIVKYDRSDNYRLGETNLEAYLALYDRQQLTRELNDFILSNTEFDPVFFEVYKEYAIPDYEMILKLVEAIPKNIWAKTIVSALRKYKEYYSLDDIAYIQKINNALSKYSEITVEIAKGMFNKDVWVCTCGKKNSMNLNDCEVCSRDKTGLSRSEQNAIQATMSFLNELIEIISDSLKN